MTEEEERQRLLAEMLRRQQEQVTTLSQSAVTPEQLAQLQQQAEYDPKGREAVLADMIRGGREAVNGDMPKGVSVGDQYFAPSWADSLNGMATKLVGGYEMGQGRKDLAAVDAERAKAAAAKEQVAAEAARVKALGSAQDDLGRMLNDERRAAMDERSLKQAADLAAKHEAAVERRLSRTLAAKGAGTGSGHGAGTKNEPTRFIDPYSGAELMAAFDKQSGTYFSPITGQPIPPDQMEGKIQESAMNEAQREKAVDQFITKNKDTFALMHDIQNAEQTWQANGMQPGENPFNWFTKQAGTLGDTARVISDIGKKGTPSQDDYAAIQTTFNTIGRLRAGLSQTNTEIARIKTETGQDPMASPEVMMHYWDRLKTKVGNDIAMANKAVSPRTIQAYQRWEGQKAASGAPVIGTEDFTAVPKITTDAEYAALPSGAVYIDPDDGKKYRKP